MSSMFHGLHGSNVIKIVFANEFQLFYAGSEYNTECEAEAMYLSEEHSFPSGNTWEISIQKKWLFDS
jgi:hypothetical protein